MRLCGCEGCSACLLVARLHLCRTLPRPPSHNPQPRPFAPHPPRPLQPSWLCASSSPSSARPRCSRRWRRFTGTRCGPLPAQPILSQTLSHAHTHIPRVLAMPRTLCLHHCCDGVGAPQALPLPGVRASPAPAAHTNSPHASTAPPYPAPAALANSTPHPLAPPPAAGARRHSGSQLRERHRAAHHAQDDRGCAACPAPSCQRMATHACSGGGDSWLCGDSFHQCCCPATWPNSKPAVSV